MVFHQFTRVSTELMRETQIFFLSPISSRPEKRKSKELSINQMKWITVMLVNQFALIQGFAAA